jgi:hypothetical protein
MKIEDPKLRKVVNAAAALEHFLAHNTGFTADWPIELTTDDPEVAKKLARRLSNLSRALNAIGKRIKVDRSDEPTTAQKKNPETR